MYGGHGNLNVAKVLALAPCTHGGHKRVNVYSIAVYRLGKIEKYVPGIGYGLLVSAKSRFFCLLAYQTKVGSIISVGLGAHLRVMHGEACRSCRSCNFVCEGMYKALDAGRLYGIINGISPAVFLYVLKLGGKRLIIAFAGEGHGLVQYFLGVAGYGEFRGISRIALAVAGERQMNAAGYLLFGGTRQSSLCLIKRLAGNINSVYRYAIMEGGGIHYLLTLLLAVNNKIVQRAQHHEKSRQYYKQDPYDLAGGFFLVFL